MFKLNYREVFSMMIALPSNPYIFIGPSKSCSICYFTIFQEYLGNSPAQRSEFVQGPVLGHRSIWETDSVAGKEGLCCVQL